MAFLAGSTMELNLHFKALAQPEGIITEGADYNQTISTEYSAALISVAGNVTPRAVMEYVDFSLTYDLANSSDLSTVARAVSSRIVIEYADFNVEMSFQSSDTLKQIATVAKPRVIVEYADFVFSSDFTSYMGPEPVSDSTPPNIGGPVQNPAADVQTHQNVTVSVNVTDTESHVKNVTLFYTTNNGTSWNSILTAYNVTSGLYQTIIPGESGGTWVKYRIVAYDYEGNHAENDNAGEYFVYEVVPEFSSFLVLSILMIATLLAVVIYKRKLARMCVPYLA
jgi:hypothetical protein